MRSPLEQFDIINIKSISILGIDFSFNNVLVPLALTLVFLVLYVCIYSNKLSIIPFYVQNLVESVYTFLINLIKQQTGAYGLF
jgi:F0F1-type ATP synthase membrane subunit a